MILKMILSLSESMKKQLLLYLQLPMMLSELYFLSAHTTTDTASVHTCQLSRISPPSWGGEDVCILGTQM